MWESTQWGGTGQQGHFPFHETNFITAGFGTVLSQLDFVSLWLYFSSCWHLLSTKDFSQQLSFTDGVEFCLGHLWLLSTWRVASPNWDVLWMPNTHRFQRLTTKTYQHKNEKHSNGRFFFFLILMIGWLDDWFQYIDNSFCCLKITLIENFKWHMGLVFIFCWKVPV